MRRIGIFGGNFDPVHLGHLRAAQACRAALGLDKVLFAPMMHPPARQPDAPAAHRLEMLRLALRGMDGLELSQVDMKPVPRYAIDTVTDLRRAYSGAAMFYLVGADKLAGIPAWKEAARLFELTEFAVYPTAGHELPGKAEELRALGARVNLVPAAQLAMTSGQVRAQLRLLSDAPGRLLPEVAAYIAGEGLYQPDYERMVRQAVSPARLAHSRGVRQTAVSLALRHRLPMQKAGVAAILHDCAKNMELARLQAIARQARLSFDEQTLFSNALLHGPVGAQIARMRYHISDTHILDAIRYHTTGRAGMNALELLIFVADAIEPSRRYNGIEQVRAEALRDLRLAALTSLVGTRDFVKTKGLKQSRLTLAGIADLRDRLQLPLMEDPAY